MGLAAWILTIHIVWLIAIALVLYEVPPFKQGIKTGGKLKAPAPWPEEKRR